MNKDKPPTLPAVARNDVNIIEPDYALRKLIGDVDLKKVFSADNITRAQGVIETHKDNFLEWVKADLHTLDEGYKSANANIPESTAEVKKLARTAFIIKSQAGTFGFALGTLVAKSLDDFCNRDYQPTQDHLTVIRKHIDALQVVFTKKISGDGGSIGAELRGNLQKLVAKYQIAH